MGAIETQIEAAHRCNDNHHENVLSALEQAESTAFQLASERLRDDAYLDDALVELVKEDNNLGYYLRELVKGRNTDVPVLLARCSIRQMVEDKILAKARDDVRKGLAS